MSGPWSSPGWRRRCLRGPGRGGGRGWRCTTGRRRALRAAAVWRVRRRRRRRTGADNRKNCSGKHKVHGLLFLALTDERGNLIWISAAKPGRSSEITAARHNKITGHLRAAGLGALADLGFVGLDEDPDGPVVITGRKATRNHRLTDAEKEANRLLNREHAAVEHGFANLKSWRFLTKIRMNARHATTLLRALLVLANTEIHR
ncbi:transposase family protein [Streptomyces sp. 5-6(2022)]|uniref:transposase family protein n=1 Tax=Streptomyces sp. 5-6(2022) TaxID=2936510 RepID=UPI0023B88D5F|nr:transposase family protein [Streptomyces sp. 5-6(2022)]